MPENMDARLRGHFRTLESRPLPTSLVERLDRRATRRGAPRFWTSFAVGVATAVALVSVIAVPLLTRTANQSGAGPSASAAIEATFVALVDSSSSTLNDDLSQAHGACAGTATSSVAPSSTACARAVGALSTDLLRVDQEFNAATVPGGVAQPMAQLVQALSAFAAAHAQGSPTPQTAITDGATVLTDLETLRSALSSP